MTKQSSRQDSDAVRGIGALIEYAQPDAAAQADGRTLVYSHDED
jgi:hypothetical protein